jgi:hypothetical protein
MLNNNPARMAKFKSTTGSQLRIARENGARFEVISENPIPRNITNWLDAKGIPWRVVPKG